ncbi:MAG TPA: RNA polymerase sigma factor [Pyrinomonadaceae bacterium]|nr:RNA polymerase sigma factor [Pyrinomonadaceae bacterium]
MNSSKTDNTRRALSDEELVRACRRGDETAWETIIYKYQKLIYSIALRAGLSPDSASDILQEVFLILFEKLETIEKPEFLRAWLVTTAQHKTIHFIQRERRDKSRSIDDIENNVSFEVSDPKPLADENLIRLEREKQIETALAAIDTRCRRLLTLIYLEKNQTPYAEIAQILGIPVGSIGPTRARCLKKLIKLLPE